MADPSAIAAARELVGAIDALLQSAVRHRSNDFASREDYDRLLPLHGRVLGLAALAGLGTPPPMKDASLYYRNVTMYHAGGAAYGPPRYPEGADGDFGRWERGLRHMREAARAMAGPRPIPEPVDTTVSQTAAAAPRLNLSQKKILKMVKRTPMSGVAISNTLGLDYNYVRRLLGRLRRLGLLTNDDAGYRTAPGASV
jgi:hypothetical protein